jgi:hypothetical protein
MEPNQIPKEKETLTVEQVVEALQSSALSFANGGPFLARDLLTAAAQNFPAFYERVVTISAKKDDEKEKTEKKDKKAGLPDVS